MMRKIAVKATLWLSLAVIAVLAVPTGLFGGMICLLWSGANGLIERLERPKKPKILELPVNR